MHTLNLDFPNAKTLTYDAEVSITLFLSLGIRAASLTERGSLTYFDTRHISPHHQRLPDHLQPASVQQELREEREQQRQQHLDKADQKTSSEPAMSAKLSLTSTVKVPFSTLQMPRLGFGVYQSSPTQCVQSCLNALRAGYRHIDSAQFYRNEEQVGQSLKECNLPRSDIFVTTKILSSAGSVKGSVAKCEESVNKIAGPDGYVDLFLIHSPNGGAKAREEMWKALEIVYEEQKARSIGVSNYGIGHIEEMKQYAKIWPPPVLQIELHPWCQQREIVAYCKEKGIIVQAYCPIVRNLKAYDTTLLKLAKKYNKTTAQVLIRYCLQKDWVPLPKSDDPDRIVANADVYDFEISKEDMELLDSLDQGADGAIVAAVNNGGW